MQVLKLVTTGLVGIALSVSMAVEAGDKVRWKMHTAFTQNTPILGQSSHRIADSISLITGGDFSIKVFEPGAIVSGTKYYDAVSNGSLDAAFGTPGFNVGKNSAYAFFASTPFGPRAGEYLAWLKHGGGIELIQEMYARDNIHYILCGVIPPETSGWFRKEISSPEDLKGLKMRFFGLGAKVMEKLGVSTQLLAGGDIYPALELGTIDAAEYSMPAIDRSKGFYQIAAHNYFPGWHQQSTTNELVINMDKWNKLSDGQKRLIENTCTANITEMFAEGEAIQFDAMIANQKDGAIIHRWSDEMIETFRSGWEQVVEDEISTNKDSAKAWDSYSKFREKYKIWGEHGYL